MKLVIDENKVNECLKNKAVLEVWYDEKNTTIRIDPESIIQTMFPGFTPIK
ncbi:MAG: hypothetical protein ACOC2M_02500 [bacterium]